MEFLQDIAGTVIGYLKADWLILLLGIIMAVGINVYVDADNLRRLLQKNSRLSVPGSVAFGALTPLCACGTMAVLLSMFISSLPWGPVMAFLVSSPLTSPSEFMFETAFLGARFATAVLISSIVLGISAGFLAHYLETNTSFFKGQFKLIGTKKESCCSKDTEQELIATISCCPQGNVEIYKESMIRKYRIDQFVKGLYDIGLRKILLAFVVFIGIGRIVEMILPQEWILTLFSGDKNYSIPLGATVGLPLYVSGSAALPLMKSFMNAGASEAAVLAFLITGKATGIPVIAGMSTILKKRAILFYVGFVYLGGIIAGYLYQLMGI
ncbi:MAG: hypothetical protein K0R93_2709 [Anaerosolibacter sp.]|uniref:permease n=1 Tax=Anaerosolibacter sp. TaxID=1872527 RepID=UPI0026098066|nr:permease [Anaerosolibacter sp.]MDF2547811.1 hypothetical protein [Anaerosolibacter sp.]